MFGSMLVSQARDDDENQQSCYSKGDPNRCIDYGQEGNHGPHLLSNNQR